jgi:capsular polysaccharide biosynthesis protein
LRYAESDETYSNGRWAATPPNLYEPEVVGDWVVELTDVTLGSHGETRRADGRWLQFPFVNIHRPRGHTTDGVVMSVDEPVWIIQNGSDAFGHWLLHVLPRIHRALQIDSTKRILTRHPGWNPSGLLAMIGLTLDDVIFFPQNGPDGGYVHVRRGTVISHAAPRGNIEIFPLGTARFDAMSEEFLRRATETSSPVGRKLYVSRSTRDVAQYRDGCQNREDLEEFFAAEGFEVVYPERYSFLEQVAMFRDADYIIAEGGSAPHNTLFSRRGTKLIYISARMKPGNNHWQRRIADLRGLHYRHVMPTHEFAQRRYTVDMDQVRDAYHTVQWA